MLSIRPDVEKNHSGTGEKKTFQYLLLQFTN